MNSKSKHRVDFGDLLDEHRHLEMSLTRVGSALHERGIRPESVAATCEALQQQVVQHFQEEEVCYTDLPFAKLHLF